MQEVHATTNLVDGSQNPIIRRNGGVAWYFTTLQHIMAGGFSWLRKEALDPRRVQQVQTNVTQLTGTVSQVAGIYITNIKSAVDPAEFFPLLNRTQGATIFPSENIHPTQTYETKLLEYRKTLKNGNLGPLEKNTAHAIFKGLGLGPADRILRPYLPDQPGSPLSSLFKEDRVVITKVTPDIGQGWVSWAWAKALGAVRLFDPIKDGNFPFLIGTRMIENKPVHVLRHPIPTVEFGTIQIAPEYKAFLEYLRGQQTSVLYDSLLHLPGQVSITSQARINLLYDLGKEYHDVFHFVRMPFDGPLSKVDEYRTLEDYRDCIKTELYNAVNTPASPSNEFVFGSKKMIDIVDNHYHTIIDFSYHQILNVYAPMSEEECNPAKIDPSKEKQKKQVFMMLVQTLLRSVLIKELEVGYYNNTCKHASDRGSAATGCDLILSHLLTDTLKDHAIDLRLTAAWPAFMAKSSAVEEGRAEWLDAFTEFVEMVIGRNKREALVEAYQKAGFPNEGKMSYYRPKIDYPQEEAEILASIAGQEAKREFSIDIEYDVEEPQSKLLNKLLEIFENQYNLTFQRIGEEGVVPETNNEYCVAKGRFVVNDRHGRTYGELRFAIRFLYQDLDSNVLNCKINSELEPVFSDMSEPEVDDRIELYV
jgi:hypothetical protein